MPQARDASVDLDLPNKPMVSVEEVASIRIVGKDFRRHAGADLDEAEKGRSRPGDPGR
jgi:hypothetical protein